MADPVAGAAITAGGNLLGGGLDAIGEGRANAREGRLSATHADNLSEFIKENVLGQGDYSNLESTANNLITRGQAGLNASMGAQGLAGSGAFQQAGVDLRSGVLSNLGEQINADQMSRSTLAGEIFSNPVFGFYDESTGQATNQGNGK